jgi:hypothetical protein
MSGTLSPGTGRAYGLARVTQVWRLSRATVYRHRTTASAEPPPCPARRGPVGACSDAELLKHIHAQILGSRLHGEGYRKIWARLRHAGIRTSARRVRRLMGQHGLLAPHRVGRPEQRAHDGTITTTAVDVMWGTDMTETVTLREGRARVFVAVDHCSGECIGSHASHSGNRFEALEPSLRRPRQCREPDRACCAIPTASAKAQPRASPCATTMDPTICPATSRMRSASSASRARHPSSANRRATAWPSASSAPSCQRAVDVPQMWAWKIPLWLAWGDQPAV